MDKRIPKVAAGMIFGRWTVLRKSTRRGYWECSCSCGSPPKEIHGGNLRDGKTNSCGCYLSEVNSKARKHGDSHRKRMTSEYICWASMLTRCYNAKRKDFHRYGGRGITVCDRWRNSFENFLEDMGRKPTPKHTLDRHPDNNGNYEKSNCRWATMKEQCNNTRRSRAITIGEKTLPAHELADIYGIPLQRLLRRLNAGWDAISALTRARKGEHNA